MSRRLAALLAAAALGLTGCGGAAESQEATGPDSADAAFPRTVEHAMGTTEISLCTAAEFETQSRKNWFP